VKHYGAMCHVCGFDFAARFGALGHGFIHVHHVVPLGSIRKGYTVNPVKDLRPVCPNCHAMLHRQSPPLGVEALKLKLR
jgi:5-methylcytosine-specific restriction enzyme A